MLALFTLFFYGNICGITQEIRGKLKETLKGISKMNRILSSKSLPRFSIDILFSVDIIFSIAFQTRMNLKGKTIKMSGKEFTLKEQLTEGGFSLIYTTKTPEIICKVQVLDIPQIANAYAREKEVLKTLTHLNIVKLHESNEIKGKDSNLGFLLLQNCTGGTIFNMLEASGQNSIPEKKVLDIFMAVASALQEIHRNGIAHRDIKLENVLISRKGEYKLCDFGSCSKEVIRQIDNSNRSEIQQNIEKTTTPLYRSPEQLDLYSGFQIGQKVDIFAMGVLVFMMCFKKQPFQSRLSSINKQYFVPEDSPYSKELIGLVEECFTTDPKLRPNAREIREKVKQLQKRKRALVELNLEKELQATFQELMKMVKSKFKEHPKGSQEGIMTKIKKIYSQMTTETEGWIAGFVEDSQEAPPLKYNRSIISKCWEKRYKIVKVYQIVWQYWEQNKSRSLVVLKLLILVHNFLRKGPNQVMDCDANSQHSPIRLATKIYNHWKTVEKPTNSDDPKRNVFVCSLIKYYSLLLIAKTKFCFEHSHLLQGNYSLLPYFKHQDETVILKLPLLEKMVNLLQICVNFHRVVNTQIYLKQIQQCLSLSLADQEYCFVSVLAFLISSFKEALNYVKEDIDLRKIDDTLGNIETRFFQLFRQVAELLKSASQEIQKGFQRTGLNLDLKVIQQIRKVKYSNQKLPGFQINKCLNYEKNIGGLKIPLTYQEVVKNPSILKDAALKSSQIGNAIDVDQFTIAYKREKQEKSSLGNFTSYGMLPETQKSIVSFPDFEKKGLNHAFDEFDVISHDKNPNNNPKQQPKLKPENDKENHMIDFSHQNLNQDFFSSIPPQPINAPQQNHVRPEQNKIFSQFDDFVNIANTAMTKDQSKKSEREIIKDNLTKDFSKDIFKILNKKEIKKTFELINFDSDDSDNKKPEIGLKNPKQDFVKEQLKEIKKEKTQGKAENSDEVEKQSEEREGKRRMTRREKKAFRAEKMKRKTSSQTNEVQKHQS